MTSTTISTFDRYTEAHEVAAAFPQTIKDRSILITGVNKEGIGYATADAFASQSPLRLILAGRSAIRINECVDSLRNQYPAVDIRPLLVDLGSQKSVKAAAAEVLSWTDIPAIHLVINNAGIMRQGESFEGEMPRSKDGIEQMFATNHLGHFLLTNLIMSKIIAAATSSPAGSTRIVNVSSSGAHISPLRPSDLEWQTPAPQLPAEERPNFAILRMVGMNVDEQIPYIPTVAYGHSKTCNILFSAGLNQRLSAKYSIMSLSLNPGEVKTELTRNTDPDWMARAFKGLEAAGALYIKKPRQGASTTLVAACDPKLSSLDVGGKVCFLSDCQIARVPAHVTNEAAGKLWQISEELTGQTFLW